MKIALIDNGVLVGFADAFPPAGSHPVPMLRIDVTGVTPAPQIGWVLESDGRTLAPPPAPPPAVAAYAKLSKNQMRRHLFAHAPSMTPTVWASLFDAAADVNTKLYAQAYQQAETISCPLDTTDPAGAADTDQGLSILVGEGKITAGEKQATIDNWPHA